MSLTKDEERLLQWSSENEEKIRKEESKETYWNVRANQGIGIEEYGFETFQEVQEYLKTHIEDPRATLIIASAAIKGKSLTWNDIVLECSNESKEDTLVLSQEIPDYIYVF